MALTVNTQNKVTTPAFTYDAAGNVTWDASHALSYDAEGTCRRFPGRVTRMMVMVVRVLK
jgi:uncharacterized protein RhaS with RHS repeats